MTTPTSHPFPSVDRDNPWPGLAAFTEDQRGFFFGREKETEELVRLIRRQTLTVLFGQSGLGKSSLLQAGVFPRLRENDFLPLYLRLDHSPDGPPLVDQVRRALTASFGAAGAEAPEFRASETLWGYFHRKDIDIWSAKNRLLTLVLAFDQFEEIFTLGRADDTRRARGAAFLSELADLVENRPPAALRAKFDAGELDPSLYNFDKPSCQVVLILREDFLPDLEGLKTEMRSILTNRMRIRRLTGTQALEIVTKPAPHLLAEGVAERVVEFVAGARGGSAERLLEMEVEPALLSVICRELNERRRALGQTQITADLVTGNRREILTDFYERCVADLPPAMRAFVEDHLLTKSGFRDNFALETALETPGVTRELIDTLVSRRLLRIEEHLGVPRVELAHDVLAEVVRTSRDARQASEALKVEERRRQEAEEALARSEAEKAAARRSLWRTRLMLAACALLALAAIYGFWVAHHAQARAEKMAAIADQSRATAVAFQALTAQSREQAEGMVGFILNELREQLELYGHSPLMLEAAKAAVAYYDGLPRKLDSTSTRASWARALTALAARLRVQGDITESDAHREQALKIFEEIERAMKLTPALRVDYSRAILDQGWSMFDRRRYHDVLPCTDRADIILRPAVNDPEMGGNALRLLSRSSELRGISLRDLGRSREAIPVLQKGVIFGDEADDRPPRPLHRGYHSARYMWLLSQVLWSNDRRREAEEINAQARARLREMRLPRFSGHRHPR